MLVADTGGDRLSDWSGEFNSFLVPFSPFGMATVARDIAPAMKDLIVQFAKSEGADPYVGALYGADPARNGEPFGELGEVTQQDAAWGDQHGSPRDPQPGNSHGKRDVLRTSGVLPIGSGLDHTPSYSRLMPPAAVAAALAALDPTLAGPAYVSSATVAGASFTVHGPTGATATLTVSDGVHSVLRR
jgi:hypothetical protein